MAQQPKASPRRAPRPAKRPKKRAIALAGGGPAAGFHIGALSALEHQGVQFDVWSLSCIGAWVGVYYNQLDGDERARRTYEFFHDHAFRDAASYEGFPVNRAFAPNFGAFAAAWWSHALSPKTWRHVYDISGELPQAIEEWSRMLASPQDWFKEAARNAFVLNNVLALHPASRFITSMAYLSGVNGLSNIYYRDSPLLAGLALERLDLLGEPGLDDMGRAQLDALVHRYSGAAEPRRQALPEIYHNAWRVADERSGVTGYLQLFNNKWLDYRKGLRAQARDYLPITRPSLCACSALPYIEQTVHLPNDDGHEYSEGALIDTVNFRNLIEDHPDLDEIWVVRIVDYRQVRRPRNLHDSLANLCQQFAAEVGENDIRLFKAHLSKTSGRVPRVVEVPLHGSTDITYRWDRGNLKRGYDEGRTAVAALLEQHPELRLAETTAPRWP